MALAAPVSSAASSPVVVVVVALLPEAGVSRGPSQCQWSPSVDVSKSISNQSVSVWRETYEARSR